MAFLKFKARIKPMPKVEESQLAALYAEFSEEDRKLAEEGVSDYSAGLVREDTR